MTFHDFIMREFGTVRQFSRFLDVRWHTARDYAQGRVKRPIEMLKKVSEHTGVPLCEILEMI